MTKPLTEIANDTYYSTGTPILTDQEYDLLADTGLEIKNFRNKTEHHRPMGSLKKLKTRLEFDKWLSISGGTVWATPKLDGNSIELVVDRGGNIIKAVTRGDGFVGNDVTDKIKHCNVPMLFPGDDIVSIPCEAIMPKTYQKFYEKNIRNVVAGILGKKEVDREELKKIDIVPFYNLPTFSNRNFYEFEDYFLQMKEGYEYEIDGIVVELEDYVYDEDDQLIPANKVALKFNKEGEEGTVSYIDWGLGKYGRLTPVIVLDPPVEIDGTSVKRISASNYALLKATKINTGAKVKVIKSGDIIPFITGVVETSPVELELPKCPDCGNQSHLDVNGVQAICPECVEDILTELIHCFRLFDLEYVSDATIETFYDNGYNTLEAIFNLKDYELTGMEGIGTRKAANIISKLKSVTLTEAQVLHCAMVKGLGGRNCEKIIDCFGDIESFINHDNLADAIKNVEGIGRILSQTVLSSMDKFAGAYGILKKYITITKPVKKVATTSYVICCTGTAPIGRKELHKVLEDMGHKVESGIKSNVNLLLTNDPESSSGKTKLAKDKGIRIVTYEEFLV